MGASLQVGYCVIAPLLRKEFSVEGNRFDCSRVENVLNQTMNQYLNKRSGLQGEIHNQYAPELD